MIFSHLFRVLDEKEASEKRTNTRQPAPAEDEQFAASPGAARRGERSRSLQVEQLKNHLAKTQPVVTEIPPRARPHKQPIQMTRKHDETRPTGFFNLRALCEEVPLSQPGSQKVLPPIRRAGTDSGPDGSSSPDELRSKALKLGKLPPIETARTKKRSAKTRWQTLTSFTSVKAREEDGSYRKSTKLFESGRVKSSQGNYDCDAFSQRRLSQPTCLRGTYTAEPAPLGNASVLYHHDDNANLLSATGHKVCLAPSLTVRQQKARIEGFRREDVPKKNFLSTSGGKMADNDEESKSLLPREGRSGMVNESQCEHYALKRLELVANSSASKPNQTPFSCKFNTTQRTNIGDTVAQQRKAPALEALYANLIVSETRRRNAICEALEQNECEDHGWSLFEKRQLLANSFAWSGAI